MTTPQQVTLPLPRRRAPSISLGFGLVGSLSAAAALAAALAWPHDRWYAVLFLQCAVPLAAYGLSLWVAARARVPGRVTFTETPAGVRLEQAGAVRRLWTVGALLLAVVGAAVALAIALGWAAPRAVTLVSAALGVVGAVSAWRDHGRGARSLRLDPAGLTLLARERPLRSLGWEDLGPVSVGPRGAALLSPGLQPPLMVDTFASDPYAVAAVVEFYRSHPHARPELLTPRFGRRLEAAELSLPPAGEPGR